MNNGEMESEVKTMKRGGDENGGAHKFYLLVSVCVPICLCLYL